MRTIERTGQFKKDFKRECKGQHRLTVENDLLTVLSQLIEDKQLAPKYRDHPLTNNWADQSELSLKMNSPSGFIFANPKTGLAYNSFYYSWHAARCRAGMPDFRVHDLRHSFASFLVNSGRSLYEVQELLGHADIRTTSRYAHLAREKLVEAVECIPVLSLNRSE